MTIKKAIEIIVNVLFVLAALTIIVASAACGPVERPVEAPPVQCTAGVEVLIAVSDACTGVPLPGATVLIRYEGADPDRPVNLDVQPGTAPGFYVLPSADLCQPYSATIVVPGYLPITSQYVEPTEPFLFFGLNPATGSCEAPGRPRDEGYLQCLWDMSDPGGTQASIVTYCCSLHYTATECQ